MLSFFRRWIKLGKKLLIDVSLDELLENSQKYDGYPVELDNIIIDKITRHPPFVTVFLLVHQKGGKKKCFIYANGAAGVISLFSESGQKVWISGVFYKKNPDGLGFVHLEIGDMRNHDWHDIVV